VDKQKWVELDLIEQAYEKAKTLKEAEAVDKRYFAVDPMIRRDWLLNRAEKWEKGQ
jgi:hypothetical protein